MPPTHQNYYKCIKAKIPKAQFAVFLDKSKNDEIVDLDFSFHSQDSHPKNVAGYIQTMIGDSGGPYWTYDRLIENEKRSILVAIHNGKFYHSMDGRNRLSITTDEKSQCRMSATKITDDILQWIKEMSGTKMIFLLE